ncbi:MAG: hypothetical protein ACAI44_32205 [Candidatus Sericytochromatia bacterium]
MSKAVRLKSELTAVKLKPELAEAVTPETVVEDKHEATLKPGSLDDSDPPRSLLSRHPPP